MFMLLEDGPQLILQVLNNVLLGQQLSMVQVITPLTGYLAAMLSLHKLSYNCYVINNED